MANSYSSKDSFLVAIRRYRAITLLAVVLAGGLCGVLPAVETPQAAPREGMLVLRHGGILSGKVTRAGANYLLALPGGQMQVHESDVEFFCSDLDEAYRMKRDALTLGRADEHLDLASWCLKHQLQGYAARELIEARLLDANHPRIALVERQLQVTLTAANRRAAPDRQPIDAQPDVPPRSDSTAAIKLLPPGALESFASQIHPILMNRCSRGGCHGPGTTSSFQLQRVATGGSFTNRATQRNLQAALDFVNRDNPAASMLLRKPMVPHGMLEQPVFAAGDVDEYATLVGWVDRLNTSPPEAMVTISTPAAGPLLQSRSVASPAEQLLKASRNEASEKSAEEPEKSAEEPEGDIRAKPRRIQHGAPPPEAPNANPYDPGAFNRGESSSPDVN